MTTPLSISLLEIIYFLTSFIVYIYSWWHTHTIFITVKQKQKESLSWGYEE